MLKASIRWVIFCTCRLQIELLIFHCSYSKYRAYFPSTLSKHESVKYLKFCPVQKASIFSNFISFSSYKHLPYKSISEFPKPLSGLFAPSPFTILSPPSQALSVPSPPFLILSWSCPRPHRRECPTNNFGRPVPKSRSEREELPAVDTGFKEVKKREGGGLGGSLEKTGVTR